MVNATEWMKTKNNDGYSISKNGIVRSDSRVVINKNGFEKKIPEKILKQYRDQSGKGYLFVSLSKNGIEKQINTHVLVGETFLGYVRPKNRIKHQLYDVIDMTMDHIDRNKLNNKLDNLRIITKREQTKNRDIKKTSKFFGVNYDKKMMNWKVCIRLKENNNKSTHLGYYDDEYKASIIYKIGLRESKSFENPLSFRKKIKEIYDRENNDNNKDK